MSYIYRVSQKKTWWYFRKLFLIIKLIVHPPILNHIEKSYRPGNFRKTACPKIQKALSSTDFLLKNIFFVILKNVLVVDLTFQFWVSRLKNVEFMDKIVRYLTACNFFVIWLLFSFLNDVDTTNFRIKNRFWKISSSMS